MALTPDFGLSLMTQGPQTQQQFALGAQTGAALGANFQQSQDRAQAQALMLQQQQQAQAQAAQQQADVAAVLKAGPTSKAILELGLKYPGMSEKLTQTYKALNEDEQRVRLSQAQRVYAAAQGGDVNTAIDILKRDAEAYRGAGRENDAKAFDDLATQLETNPDAAVLTTGSFLAGVMGPEQFSKTFETSQTIGSTTQKAAGDAAKATAEAKVKETEARFANDKAVADLALTKAQKDRLYAQSKNEAERLGFDREKFTAEQLAARAQLEREFGKLPEGVRKDVDAAVENSSKAKLQAQMSEDLAKKFREYDRTGNFSASGARAWAAEGLKDIFGAQDAVSTMRRQHKALVGSLVVTNLPPGAASDTDIALIKSGFPSENASPAVLADFHEASARVQRAVERVERQKSSYLSKNQSLGPARTDFTIGNILVRAGETFEEAADRAYAASAPAASSTPTAAISSADAASAATF